MVWCCNTSGPRTLPRASTGTDQQEGQKLVLWTFHFKNTLNGSTWCMSSFLGDTGSIQLLGFHGLPTRLTHTKISGQSAGTSCWALTPNQKKPEKVHYGDCPTYGRWEPVEDGSTDVLLWPHHNTPWIPMAFHTLVTWCPTCRVQFVEQTLLESAIEPKSRLELPTKSVAISCSWMMASPTWMPCPRCKTKWIKSLDEINYHQYHHYHHYRSRFGQ